MSDQTGAWLFAGIVFVFWMLGALLVGWVRQSLLDGRGLPWRILLKRAEEDPYFNREYARPIAEDAAEPPKEASKELK